MLNSLANHGYLPRNGRNVSIDQVVNAIDLALNLSPLSSRPVVELAATTSTTGYATTFNLDDLNLHGGACPPNAPLTFQTDLPQSSNTTAVSAARITPQATTIPLTSPSTTATRRALSSRAS